MAPASPPKPTDAELEILTVLWSRGPSTVRDVHEVIAGRKPTQYTTVLKQLQVMAEKGLVRRDEQQRSHVYAPARPREWTQRQLAGDLLQRAFEGSARGTCCWARYPPSEDLRQRNSRNCAACSTHYQEGKQ
jgi:BlaI family transcriptional regulator, penicillinase repressor